MIKAPIDTYEVFIELNANGDWVVDIEGEKHQIWDEAFHVKMALLNYLDICFTDFHRMVSCIQNDANIKENFTQIQFPYSVIIGIGFEVGSSISTTSAIEWLSKLDNIDISEFKEYLEKVINKKKAYDQKTRQIAMRLLKKQ